jgi:hypothetical protein
VFFYFVIEIMKGFFHLNYDLNGGIQPGWGSAQTRLAATPAICSGAWVYFPVYPDNRAIP